MKKDITLDLHLILNKIHLLKMTVYYDNENYTKLTKDDYNKTSIALASELQELETKLTEIYESL